LDSANSGRCATERNLTLESEPDKRSAAKMSKYAIVDRPVQLWAAAPRSAENHQKTPFRLAQIAPGSSLPQKGSLESTRTHAVNQFVFAV
jgi:hypothetical protein